MRKRLGVANYQYEAIENWPEIDIPGVASDVATDSEGRVYIATRTAYEFDSRAGMVMVFDRDGKFLRSFGDDKLRCPHHIWISSDDEIYLADSFDHVIRHYNLGGELIEVIGTPGQPGITGGPFNQPTGAMMAPGCGDLFVADGYRQCRVHRFDSSRNLQLSWGSGDWHEYDFAIFGYDPKPGTGPGEFALPHGISIDRNDQIYIMDRENDRIQVFDVNGKYLYEWSITNPNQAFIDESDVMHSASNGQVYVSKLDGELIGSWCSMGPEPWQFTGGPHGIWIDSRGDVYVAQVGKTNALNKYARI
jgi:hypothetical protein